MTADGKHGQASRVPHQSRAATTASAATVQELWDYCISGFSLGASTQWASFDPFDMLLSPVASVFARTRLLRRIVVRMGRGAGAAARWRLGIRPHAEPKAMADFLTAACRLHAVVPALVSHVPDLIERLIDLAVETPSGSGWGLGFPYASRYVDVAPGTPNAYTTVNVANALLAASAFSDDIRCIDYAVRAASFVRHDLGELDEPSGNWFRYWPGLDSPITNVQALIAGFFASLGRVIGDPSLVAKARATAAAVIAVQRSDGAWNYGLDIKGSFVDSFHSGFVLQGLSVFASEDPVGATAELHESIARGLRYFTDHLISADIRPLDFADGRPTTDVQAAAQSVQTMLLADPVGAELAVRAWRHLPRLPGGDDTRWPTTELSLRWEVGPAVLATAELASRLSSKSDPG